MSCVLLAAWPALAVAMPWEVGAKAGLNVAGFRGDFHDLAGTERKLGFVGGPFAACRMSTSLALQGEILYSTKGAMTSGGRVDPMNPLVIAEQVWRLDYIEAPILLRFSPPFRGHLRPDLMAGTSFAFNVNATFENRTSGVRGHLDEVKTLDVGLVLGVGAHFGGRGLGYFVEGRYSRGFSDIYNLEGNFETIHDVFSVLVGISR